MAVLGWKTKRYKGVSEVTLEIQGVPTITIALYGDLVKALIAETERSEVGAVLLTGPPGKFMVGLDIHEIAALSKTEEIRGSTAVTQDLLNDLEAVPSALLCAIDGECFGGGFELVLPFHLILATPSSRFGFPEIKIGTIPSFGGTQRLSRIAGRNRALKVMMTGEPFTAKSGVEWGVVASVVKKENLISKARQLAQHLAGLSRPALRALLKCTLRGLDIPVASGMALESSYSSRLAGGRDLMEGIQAFFERRAPLFPSTLIKSSSIHGHD
jgi:enoyl-CoA hydratase/carnithine racemase